MTDKNNWDLWQNLLGTPNNPPRDSDVTTGYWRLPRGSAGIGQPVCTWNDKGTWFAEVDDQPAFDMNGERWSAFVAKVWPLLIAVDQEDYESALQNSKWPDGTPTKAPRSAAAEPGGPGHNSGATEEDVIALAEAEIDKAEILIAAGAAQTAEAADLASNVAKSLTTARGSLEAKHKVEKEPSLVEGRRIDAIYLPLVRKATALATKIKADVINPFQVAEKKKAQDAAAALAAEQEAAKALGEVPPDAPAPVAAPIKVTSGSAGRKSSLQTIKYGEITDPIAFATFLLTETVAKEDIMVVMVRYANRLAGNVMYKEGDTPAPGLLVKTREVTR